METYNTGLDPLTEKENISLSDKNYRGLPYSVWNGLFIGSIVVLILHSTIGFLMMGFLTQPIGLLVAIPDVAVVIPLIILSSIGKKRSYVNSRNYTQGIGSIIFWSVTFYMGLLWGIHSYIKPAPSCEKVPGMRDEDFPMICSWAKHPLQYYIHAIPGPLALLCSVFNIMKFSRGQVFPIAAHVWVGRVHNIAIIVASIGAVMLGSVSATPNWIKMGFWLLLCLWLPTMLVGWYYGYKGDIPNHKRWMIRNFACTAAAITLRCYNLVTLGNTPYYLMVYLSLIHIIITEVILQREKKGW